MIVSSRFNVSKWGRFKSKFNHVGRGWTISTSLNHHRINLSIIHVSKPPLSMPYIQILLLERPVFYSLLLSLQLPVCSDTADLLAPSAGDAGDLQLSGPDAVGWTHPRGGDGTLPQPDYGQEKGSWAFFFFFMCCTLTLIVMFRLCELWVLSLWLIIGGEDDGCRGGDLCPLLVTLSHLLHTGII